jgi:ditrans,polycis-polyprenyl diphosphate synthase
MIEVLCSLGVSTMTFFMFGVENFKRNPEEIANLWKIIKDRLSAWTSPQGLAHRLEFRLNLCGERELLPEDLVHAIDQAAAATEHYTKSASPLPAFFLTRDIDIVSPGPKSTCVLRTAGRGKSCGL